jgi:hypothetical protein
MVKLLYHYRNRMKTSSGQYTGKGELRKEGSNKAETGIWGQNFRLFGRPKQQGCRSEISFLGLVSRDEDPIKAPIGYVDWTLYSGRK